MFAYGNNRQTALGDSFIKHSPNRVALALPSNVAHRWLQHGALTSCVHPSGLDPCCGQGVSVYGSIILCPVKLSPVSIINGVQTSFSDGHLCCNPSKAPCLTQRERCVVFLASLACSKLLYNSWLTHPLQCGKQVVPPRAEGSRGRTDGAFSVSSWGGVGETAWVLYITLNQQVSGRCFRLL